ncbi:hypothetical protein AB0H17_09465 [Streptomyces olivoreticuli]
MTNIRAASIGPTVCDLYGPGLAVSASQVGRILACVDLKPHLVRGWLTRPADPEFFTRAADVCALYRTCPANAVVISVDEKTWITAPPANTPTSPAAPGSAPAGSSSTSATAPSPSSPP